MELQITVDTGPGAAAPYAQVREQVTAAVADGRLPAGERLPTVRALAEQVGVAVNTVAKAYRELERDGVVVTRGRAGTFVSGDDAARAAREAAAAYVARARALGLPDDAALALVREHLRAL